MNTSLYSSYSNSQQLKFEKPQNDSLCDTIQDIKFGDQRLFAAAGWDGLLRLYTTNYQGGYGRSSVNPRLESFFDFKEPVLSISWNVQNWLIFLALSDNTIVCYNCATGQTQIVGQHNGAPARSVFWNKHLNCAISIGLDKNLFIWDPRSNNINKPIQLTSIPCVAEQDEEHRWLAYGDLDCKIKLLDVPDKLRMPSNSYERSIFVSEESKLSNNSQLSSMAISYSQSQLAYGSVDGRVAVVEITQRLDTTSKIVFKCCKVDEEKGYKIEKSSKFYVVNTMQFNPRAPEKNWLATGGGDGSISIWDIQKKNKILQQTSPVEKTAVTAISVSPMGDMLAAAYGYDWSRGLDGVGEPCSLGVALIEPQWLKYNN